MAPLQSCWNAEKNLVERANVLQFIRTVRWGVWDAQIAYIRVVSVLLMSSLFWQLSIRPKCQIDQDTVI
jgi:hypothetical protein